MKMLSKAWNNESGHIDLNLGNCQIHKQLLDFPLNMGAARPVNFVAGSITLFEIENELSLCSF